MSATTARPFQVGDRVLVTRDHHAPYSGTVEMFPGTFLYVRRDDDPEHTRTLDVINMTDDRTAARFEQIAHVELWDGPINGASTGVDTYDCPEPGCDFNLSAVGPVDPDEGDLFAEDIEQHKRGHELAAEKPAPPTAILWTDSYGAEHELHPVGTAIHYNGVEDRIGDLDGESAVITGHDLADEVTPYEIRFTGVERMASPDHFWVPGTTTAPDLDRTALADQLAAAADHLETAAPGCDCPLHMAIAARAVATDRALRTVTLPPADDRSVVEAVARGVSSQAGLQAVMHGPTIPSGGAVKSTPALSGGTTPSLVQLDRAEAAMSALHELADAAIEWQDADPYQPAGIAAEGALSERITAYRTEVGR